MGEGDLEDGIVSSRKLLRRAIDELMEEAKKEVVALKFFLSEMVTISISFRRPKRPRLSPPFLFQYHLPDEPVSCNEEHLFILSFIGLWQQDYSFLGSYILVSREYCKDVPLHFSFLTHIVLALE